MKLILNFDFDSKNNIKIQIKIANIRIIYKNTPSHGQRND